jgi:hypothetical protein
MNNSLTQIQLKSIYLLLKCINEGGYRCGIIISKQNKKLKEYLYNWVESFFKNDKDQYIFVGCDTFHEIHFKNKSCFAIYYECYSYHESFRGKRFNQILIDEELPQRNLKDFNEIILPMMSVRLKPLSIDSGILTYNTNIN